MKYNTMTMCKGVLILIQAILWSTALGQGRHSETINTGWQFHKGDFRQDTKVEESDWQTVNIPHTWNQKDAFEGNGKYYRGVGWYRKAVIIPEDWKGRKIYLHFEAANQETQVFLNHEPIGHHRGGYNAFRYDITDIVQYGKTNQLRVKLDNRHNWNIPPLDADFTFYGGIYRDVHLITVSPTHFEMDNYASDGVFVKAEDLSEASGKLKVWGKVKNEEALTKRLLVKSVLKDADGHTVMETSQKLKLAQGTTTDFMLMSKAITQPHLWSPEDPYLYTVETKLIEQKTGKVLDEVETSFGFRWFSIDADKGFFLNGKHLKLVGANRHQDYKGLGNALPNAIHRKDMKLLKEMGANFIRIAHYPHDPEVYKACDELGLLSWSEIPVINDVTDTEEYFKVCTDMQLEHIRQNYNHPSIVMWGYMNEIFIRMVFNRKMTKEDKDAKIDATLRLARKLEDITRTEDAERITVMALHGDQVYNETGIADIPQLIGWNLYYGWYVDDIYGLGKFLDEEHRNHPERPLFLSEYGPGADTRINTFTPKIYDFSADYQRLYHSGYLTQILERDYMAGMTAWNFADFGSAGRHDTRPFINQKGLMNYDRQPKDVYYLYQSYLLKEPVLKITGGAFAKRQAMEGESGKGVCNQDVIIFTNQPSVELFHNGKSLGIKNALEKQVVFSVPFKSGDNTLKAIAGKTEDQLIISFDVVPQELSAYNFGEINVNAGAGYWFNDETTGEVWMPDRKYQKGQWGYIEGEPYRKDNRTWQGVPRNIEGTDNDPLFQNMRVNPKGYTFDVTDGNYEVTLYFVEPNAKVANESAIYELSASKQQNETPRQDVRIFNVKMNGKTVLEGFNIGKEFGAFYGVEKTYSVKAENGEGIQIVFESLHGQPLVSALKVRKQ
ncbi:glycoside hydrolase family 2 TIM barrel-domain containing protein [Limibacter armeniacum]|uniref:glycoside hydrolase family 2 TIM barrel-domain containing protein n=1 Tax=Limibacter armeniacum TaxID=466084 RepID=UPI002FE5D373